MSKDYFAHKADSYEKNRSRVDNVAHIAEAILSRVTLDPGMQLLDFGSGTGLLLERIAPRVRKITAVDISSAMNAQLEAKRAQLPCELELVQIDLESQDLPGKYDGIISSMTMHHVRDVGAMFRKFHQLVKPGGFIAIADLDKEDGSFHSEDTGVFHAGFAREDIMALATAAGFTQAATCTASTISKPQGEFPIFLLTARRKAG